MAARIYRPKISHFRKFCFGDIFLSFGDISVSFGGIFLLFGGISVSFGEIFLLNFRKWFKYGLAPTRPERAEAPSPGQRPGYNGNQQGALKGQKLYVLSGVLKLLPLQGDRFASVITQGDALGGH